MGSKPILKDTDTKQGLFAIGETVRVKTDKRVGQVLNFWRQRSNGSITKQSFKYLVLFGLADTQYFQQRELEKT